MTVAPRRVVEAVAFGVFIVLVVLVLDPDARVVPTVLWAAAGLLVASALRLLVVRILDLDQKDSPRR